jgi:signal transduction histidine kinase
LLVRSVPKTDEGSEFAQFILDGVKSATNVVEQLLTFSRAGTGTSRTWLPLSAAVQAAVYKLNDRLTEAKAQVVYGQLPEVSVNQADMEKLFENLIDNSLKYRGSEPPIIEISADESDGVCTVTVRDNGPGIGPEYRQLVLKPFKRLHDSRIPGSGLGLAVCKKIVQNHQGRLWIDGDERGGTVVRFTLPL